MLAFGFLGFLRHWTLLTVYEIFSRACKSQALNVLGPRICTGLHFCIQKRISIHISFIFSIERIVLISLILCKTGYRLQHKQFYIGISKKIRVCKFQRTTTHPLPRWGSTFSEIPIRNFIYSITKKPSTIGSCVYL